MKNSDLWIVAYFLSVICFAIYYFQESSKLSKVRADLNQAMTLAVEFYDDRNELLSSVDMLNDRLAKMKKMDRLVRDLDRIPRDAKKLVIANCYDETNLNYNAVHKSKFDKSTRGICGIKTEWIDVIPELNKDNINSLYAGYLVLDYLIAQEGDVTKALKKYKGSIINNKPIHRTLALEKLINI